MKSILFFLTCTFFISCSSDYSSGERVGVISKFSNKGLMFKTYEGTLNLGGLRQTQDSKGNANMVANTWDFSIDAKHHRGESIQSLIDTIQKAINIGAAIRVHYNQELNTDWLHQRGSTGYFVDKVQIIY